MTLVRFSRQRGVWKRGERRESPTICTLSRAVRHGREARGRANREVGREQKAERGETVSIRNKANTELNVPEQVRRRRGLRKGLEFCLQKRGG